MQFFRQIFIIYLFFFLQFIYISVWLFRVYASATEEKNYSAPKHVRLYHSRSNSILDLIICPIIFRRTPNITREIRFSLSRNMTNRTWMIINLSRVCVSRISGRNYRTGSNQKSSWRACCVSREAVTLTGYCCGVVSVPKDMCTSYSLHALN